MSILGARVTTAELHLDYVAGDRHGTSPIDLEVKTKANAAQGDLVSTAVASVFSSVYSTIDNLVSGLVLWPLVPLATRATFMGSDPTKVCAAVNENAKVVQEFSSYLGKGPTELLKSSTEYLNSFGLPVDLSNVRLSDDPSAYENWVGRQGFKLLQGADYVGTSVGDWFKELSSNSACAQKITEGNWTYADRFTNYLGSVLTTGKKLYNYEYSEHTPYILAGVFAALSIWSFAETLNVPAQAGQEAKDMLIARFDDMATHLKKMQAEMVANPFVKGQAVQVATGILANETNVMQEIEELKLPQLSYENRKAIVKKVVVAAQSILRNAKPQAA